MYLTNRLGEPGEFPETGGEKSGNRNRLTPEGRKRNVHSSPSRSSSFLPGRTSTTLPRIVPKTSPAKSPAGLSPTRTRASAKPKASSRTTLRFNGLHLGHYLPAQFHEVRLPDSHRPKRFLYRVEVGVGVLHQLCLQQDHPAGP